MLINLWRSPEFRTTVKKKELQQLLLETAGWLFCLGNARNIRSKHIGAGVYEVWTEAQK